MFNSLLEIIGFFYYYYTHMYKFAIFVNNLAMYLYNFKYHIIFY